MMNDELGMMNNQRVAHSSFTIHHLSLNLAPNPATTEVQISMEGLGESGSGLTVFDAQGRTVWQRRVGSSEALTGGALTLDVSVEKFAAGLYFVTLRSDGQVVTKRLVVQRL